MKIETSNTVPGVDSICSKDGVRKAIASLQSYSSSLASFTRNWKALDTHFSSIEKSIEQRFRDLEAKESSSIRVKPVSALMEEEEEIEPRPELKSLCAKMDGMGLRSYIIKHRKDIQTIRRELSPALRSALDPVAIVLDSLDGFLPSKNKKEKHEDVLSVQRTCVSLLECLQGLAPDIKPSDIKRAESVAMEWKGKISDAIGDKSLAALGFLQLVGIFGLVDSFEVDEILDLLVLVARRKQTVELCRSFGIEDKMTDFVNKLNSKGRQLDAVKFIFAFNLSDQYPPDSLLKAYVKESKKAAQEVRQKGNNSRQSVNEAIAKEIAALTAVIKVVEEYKLGSIYGCENLHKRIEQLEKQKAEKKRAAAAAASTDSKVKREKQNQHQPNKRLRPSASAAPSVAAPLQPHKLQPQLGLVDRTTYHSLAAAASSIYDHGGHHAALQSHLYPSESQVGSGYYNKPFSYDEYAVSGLPNRYNMSLYR